MVVPRYKTVLRCGERATVWWTSNVHGFSLLGFTKYGFNLWTERGRWRSDGREHHLDIVSPLQLEK